MRQEVRPGRTPVRRLPVVRLADLLDRVLDKGLFLRADLVISLAGIPLIGATLSVAVAGTETLLKYGILSDWDEAIRAVPPEQRRRLQEPIDSESSGGMAQGA